MATATAPRLSALPDPAFVRRVLCTRSFRHWLRFWHFKNRETGAVSTYREPEEPCSRPGCQCIAAGLWEGQRQLAAAAEAHPWVYGLKAGKQGFTELECAFDGWRLLLGAENTRVHMFSLDQRASQALLGYVRFGLEHLPPALACTFEVARAGGVTSQSLIVRGAWMGPDDVRTIVSYPAVGHASIDQTCQHAHVDELSQIDDAEALWNGVVSTVAPGGTCHVITRGRGPDRYSADLWHEAVAGGSRLHPLFVPYTGRPGRDAIWRESLVGTMTPLGLSYFAPETADDALAGDPEAEYIPLDRWDQLHDPELPPLRPGWNEPIVLAADAAVTYDNFGVVAVTRHPKRHDQAAIRACKRWRPQDSPAGRIDLEECERWIRLIIEGGCAAGHPRSLPNQGCAGCKAKDWPLAPHNVVQFTYDPTQLEQMVQRMRKDGLCWISEFDQGAERLVADGMLFQLAMAGQVWHNGDPALREHIGNAKARLQKDEDSKMRIVKRRASEKVDLAVAASMAVKRILELNV